MNCRTAHRRCQGLTLIELVVVASLSSLLIWGAIHSVTTISQEENPVRRLTLNPSLNDYTVLNAVLQDRLAQAWDFAYSNQTATANYIYLYNNEGKRFARFYVSIQNINTVVYLLQDVSDLGTSTPVYQSWTYYYTNHGDASSLLIVSNINHTVQWQIPPPFYVNAETNSFAPLLVGQDAATRLDQLRTSKSAMLQRECRTYLFNPTCQGYR